MYISSANRWVLILSLPLPLSHLPLGLCNHSGMAYVFHLYISSNMTLISQLSLMHLRHVY